MFWTFPRLVGQYCYFLLLNQDPATRTENITKHGERVDEQRCMKLSLGNWRYIRKTRSRNDIQICVRCVRCEGTGEISKPQEDSKNELKVLGLYGCGGSDKFIQDTHIRRAS